MARRFEANESSVSLFPFLSILACVIGVLTLMITSLALTSMGGSEGLTEEELSRAEALPRLKEESQKLQSEIADLEKRVTSASLNEGRLNGLRAERDELKRREKTLNDAAALAAEIKKLQGTAKSKKDRLAALNREKSTLEKKVASLSGEINTRSAPAVNRTLQLRRGAGPQKYVPSFVEAAGNGRVVLHAGNKPHAFPASKLPSDKAFNDLVNRLKDKSNQQLVILVRDDGIGTMDAINRYASQKNVITGRVPLLGQGPVDLTKVSQ